ncbi:MAG: proton-conducting transporter membrane subunit [Bryobacteraceae bacterium]
MRFQDSTELAAGRRGAVWAQGYAVLSFLSALAVIGYLDRLTSVLLVLSTFLFAIVTRYSMRYMMGDPGQRRFMFWLCLTSTFVFALVLAPNLPIFITAWCGISLSLHQLLQFYGDRPSALLAARKKFLVSRLGDVALLAVLVLTYQTFGTWNFQELLAAAEKLRLAGHENLPAAISGICCLLVFAALLKSAQFPFHTWLPDTMETPTPVSALMHAGIINAGGILVIRLSPLISLSNTAMLILCLVGGFTAIFASSVMLTQASIKRCLAFSTVAQMGFMMLECGLGAFHLALVHLVAHSLYKAHAFLSSGSAVQSRPTLSQRPQSLAVVVSSIFAGIALTFLTAQTMSMNPVHSLALNLIFSIALAQMLWTLFGTIDRGWKVPLGLIAALAMSITYFALDMVAQLVVKPTSSAANWTGVFIACILLLAAVAQSQLPRLLHSSLGLKLYVHARNGFYLNTLANRLTSTLWPIGLSKEGI